MRHFVCASRDDREELMTKSHPCRGASSGPRWVLTLALAAVTAAAWPAAADPVVIRMGAGPAPDEQLWLMEARHDLTPNQGKAYIYKLSITRGTNARYTAYEAGQIDAGSSSMTGALFASSKGIPIKIVAKEARESNTTFSTSYMALADSDVSLKTLKGKTIGLNGFRTSLELYARVAVIKAGLNPERDIKWLTVGLPQMADALRSHKIDVGVFPTQFAFFAKREGGIKTVWTSAGISGIEEEQDVYFAPDFVAKHPDAVRAWVHDLANVTRYLLEHQKEARQSLLDAKFVNIDPKIYLAMTAKDDLERSADVKPNADTMRRLQDLLLKVGFTDKKVDVDKIVDASFVP
jgi:ABC-type nitrate/sulfonate/bicarbonate transport system substrate-binding protein